MVWLGAVIHSVSAREIALCDVVITGVCAAERITCLVVDECHRATGKADVVLAVKRLRDASVKFRVLGLSATPGRDRESVQARCVT